MPVPSVPIVDEDNPFYCPALPAALYLKSVHKQVLDSLPGDQDVMRDDVSMGNPGEDTFPSFVKILDQSVNEEDLLELLYRRSVLEDVLDDHNSSLASVCPTDLRLQHLGSRPTPSLVRDAKSSPAVSSTFSDFQGPAKYERSLLDVNEASFELTSKAEKIRYFASKASPISNSVFRTRRVLSEFNTKDLQKRIRTLEEELYGPPIGTESPRGLRTLIARLDKLMPGIRIRDRLLDAGASSHQQLADILSAGGYLNARILGVLRTSEIECLDLSASLTDEGGLNLEAKEILSMFAKPNGFLFLNELNFTGAELRDSDMIHVHHLPRLARLWLTNTGIGNEAIFLLTSLKRSLCEIDIAYNPGIDDDAIPALLIFSKLYYLTFQGTSVTMIGLRRLARTLHEKKRDVEIEVPRVCEEYIDKMPKKYMLCPSAPLITDPSAVSTLSTSALIRNLSAHAEFNPEISCVGSLPELMERLKRLLEIREMDLQARALVWREGR